VTFHDQLRATFRLGSGIFLGSAIILIAMYGARTAGYVGLSDTLSTVALIVLVVALLTLVAGLVGRSAHRWVWFNVVSRSERVIFGRTAAERLLASPASPILRWWLHIDPDGHDRDGVV
jgi:hypothetical protein